MVEITYQMVLSTLQTVGLLVGIFYYVTTLRNAQKTRELTLQSQELTRKAQEQALETRQAQLFMQIYQEMSSPEFYRIYNELLHMEWEDWDDYYRKYGSDNNPEAFAVRNSLHYRLNGVGLLVKADLIDVDRVYDLMRTTILWQWNKWEDIILKARELYNVPSYMEGFEFIAEEMVKESESRGVSVEVPESYGGYVPTEKEDT